MKLHSVYGLGLALAILSPTLFAQADSESQSITFEVTQRFAAWNQDNGSTWRNYADKQTGYLNFLFGGNAAAAFEPSDDEDFFVLGRLAIEDTENMHGIASETLVTERVLHLPLELMGSSDKFTVRFTQAVDGVPVLGGKVNTLFTTDGRLLSVQSSAMPGVTNMSTSAAVTESSAIRQALAAFESETGLVGNIASGPTKAIGQVTTDGRRAAKLVWQVEVEWRSEGVQPEGYSYWIDATAGGVVFNQTTVHNVDVGGTVSTYSSPGILPNQASNPPTLHPMNHARVNGSGGAGTVYTDQNGNYNFPGVTGPINVTFDYFGDWVDVNNDPSIVAGDYTQVEQLTGTGNITVLNPGAANLDTNQSNCFQVVSAERDWIVSVNPSDTTGDFRALANANLPSTCNAYFDGSSVNMFQSGGGCNSTAYSTVVAHEMGHWYNVLYGTGNGSDGMGEGNADIFALYMYNTQFLGMDFQGQGAGPLRNGVNTLMYCGDGQTGCHGGGVHTEGQVWMGAAWKIYLSLETAYGTAQADIMSDALFLGWMNSFNQTQIHSVIETQWLTLDDDNGNYEDGTPHYLEIDAGFRAQGFPGYDLPPIRIQNVNELGTQSSEAGPYVVNADVSSYLGLNITSVDIMYSADGGAYVAAPMSMTTGNTWSGGIPGLASPVVVRYYVIATDSAGNTRTVPEDAPGSSPVDTFKFVVGNEVSVYFEDFEAGEGGWTHASFGTTPNTQDDWQFGTPGGLAGDPGSAASGANCFGNDLSIGNFNGAYQDDIYSYLLSSPIDCTGIVGATLRYKRWLTVEEGIYDQARIRINGVEVWANALSGNLIDQSWVTHDIDISAVADGNPTVVIEFSLQSDAGLTFGGWTVDDIEILYLEALGPACNTPTTYGLGKLSSAGTFPTLTAVNMPSQSANNFALKLDFAVPNVAGVTFSGPGPDSVALLGALRLVSLPIRRDISFMTDSGGSATIPHPIDPGSSGTKRFYQAWFRDLGAFDGTTAGLSNAIEVEFCD
ncbi:MAG: hypothetical protein ACI8X5_001061 [Planctomycetota bacterium]|jgi:hypothetical protein